MFSLDLMFARNGVFGGNLMTDNVVAPRDVELERRWLPGGRSVGKGQ